MSEREFALKIYKDEALTDRIVDNVLDFEGVFVGETKQFTVWIANDDKAFYTNLRFILEHSEAKVVEAPTELSPKAVATLTLEWSPKVTLDEPLRTQLRISGIRELRP